MPARSLGPGLRPALAALLARSASHRPRGGQLAGAQRAWSQRAGRGARLSELHLGGQERTRGGGQQVVFLIFFRFLGPGK